MTCWRLLQGRNFPTSKKGVKSRRVVSVHRPRWRPRGTLTGLSSRCDFAAATISIRETAAKRPGGGVHLNEGLNDLAHPTANFLTNTEM